MQKNCRIKLPDSFCGVAETVSTINNFFLKEPFSAQPPTCVMQLWNLLQRGIFPNIDISQEKKKAKEQQSQERSNKNYSSVGSL